MFDPYAKLAEILGQTPATSATIATQAQPVSQLSQVSQPPEPRKPAFRVAAVAGVATPPNPETPPDAADDAFDHFEERAAIREFDGGQTRAEAEAAALAEASWAVGVAPEALRQSWAAHPDAAAYLAMLHRSGPQTCGAAGSILGWGATRAWQAEARLRTAGLVTLGALGKAQPTERNMP